MLESEEQGGLMISDHLSALRSRFDMRSGKSQGRRSRRSEPFTFFEEAVFSSKQIAPRAEPACFHSDAQQTPKPEGRAAAKGGCR